jgi:hypothetical protein
MPLSLNIENDVPATQPLREVVDYAERHGLEPEAVARAREILNKLETPLAVCAPYDADEAWPAVRAAFRLD